MSSNGSCSLLSALVGAALVLLSAQQAMSQAGLDALDRAMRESDRADKRLEAVRPRNVTPGGSSSQIDTDVRRQKEEAADSLNRTLRDIDERARTRAIEGGKGVIIQ